MAFLSSSVFYLFWIMFSTHRCIKTSFPFNLQIASNYKRSERTAEHLTLFNRQNNDQGFRLLSYVTFVTQKRRVRLAFCHHHSNQVNSWHASKSLDTLISLLLTLISEVLLYHDVLFPPRSVESRRTRAHIRRSCTKTATSKHNSRFLVFFLTKTLSSKHTR